jgi:uncharacterized protein YacL
MGLSVLAVLFGWILAGNESSGVDLMLRWMYVMLGLAVGLMLIMSLFALAQNPKSAVQALAGLAAVLVIVGISFALSSAEPVTTPTNYYDNPVGLRVADTALYAMYILMAGAVVAIILGELRNAFK